MPRSVQYIGTQRPFFEIAITGKPSSWYPGQISSVPDADADLLVASGQFRNDAEDGVIARFGPNGELLSAVGKTAFGSQLSRPVKFGVLGDSIQANQTLFTSESLRYLSEASSCMWGLAFAGVAYDWIANGGVSGQTSTQILARTDAFIAANPGLQVVYFSAGVNDIASGAATQPIIDNLIAIVRKLVAAGIYVVHGGILPFAAANAYRAGQVTTINRALGAWWQGGPGGRFVDHYAVFADTASALGAAKAGYTSDGTHPINRGGFALGQQLAPIFAELMPAYTLANSPVDSRVAITECDQLFANPTLQGTGGGNGANATGTVPTDCAVAGSATVSCVSSVADANSGAGKKVVIAMTASAAGSATFRTIDTPSGLTGAGKWLRAGSRVKVISASNLNRFSCSLSSDALAGTWGVPAGNGIALPANWELPVVLTPAVNFTPWAASLAAFWTFGFSGAGSATVEIEQVELRELA